MNLKINSCFVAAVAQFMAKSDIRYYLNGIYVEPVSTGGAVIVATNGHVMGMWLDPDGRIDRPVILRTTTKLLGACTIKGAKYLQLVEDRLTVTDQKNLELFVQPNREKWEIEGSFPDWKRQIPKTEIVPTLFDGLNPAYVTLVTNALKLGTGVKERWAGGITFNQPKPSGPIIVTSNKLNAENFFAVIMPLRDSVSHQPKWAQSLNSASETPLPEQQPSDAAPQEGGAA